MDKEIWTWNAQNRTWTWNEQYTAPPFPRRLGQRTTPLASLPGLPTTKPPMQKKQIYTVYDRVANDIGPLMMFVNDAPAIRFFSDLMTSHEMMRKYPADYSLVVLGDIGDTSTGATICINSDPYARVVIEGSTWASAQATTKGE